MELEPGTFHLSRWLAPDRQEALVGRCLEIGAGPAGFYRPTVRGGGQMRIDMVCLGRHWNAKTYRYETHRTDHDGLPAPPLPADLAAYARAVTDHLGLAFEPDICILNRYPADGRLGLHQDKDERPETLAAGVPIVSLSLGDTARFLLGGLRRRDPVRTLLLGSGDALVLAGPSRLRYHGVVRLLPGTAPPTLGIQGRLNLTYRQY